MFGQDGRIGRVVLCAGFAVWIARQAHAHLAHLCRPFSDIGCLDTSVAVTVAHQSGLRSLRRHGRFFSFILCLFCLRVRTCACVCCNETADTVRCYLERIRKGREGENGKICKSYYHEHVGDVERTLNSFSLQS